MENGIEVEAPLKVTNRTTMWFTNSTSESVSRERKNTDLERYLHPYVHSSIMDNIQDMKTYKQPMCPSMDKWIKKYLHILWIKLNIYAYK